ASRHSLRPTLFPYTTLFRSEIRNVRILRNRIEQSQVNPVGAARGVAIVALPRRASNAGPERHLVNQRRCDCADQVQGQVPGGIPDRKSTRLNSSHQIISYAV